MSEFMDVVSDSGASAKEIQCMKCKEMVEFASLDEPSKAKFGLGKRTGLTETVCANNYKALTRRWKSNPKLREWWQEKGLDGQAEWYKKNKAVFAAGEAKLKGGRACDAKRPIDVSVTLEHVKTVGTEMKRRRKWIPFEVWAEKQILLHKCKDMTQCVKDWKVLLMQPSTTKSKLDGEWHISVYKGVISDEVESDIHQQKVKQGASAESASDARDIVLQQEEAFLKARERYDNQWVIPGEESIVKDIIPDDMVEGVFSQPENLGCEVMAMFLQQIEEREALAQQLEQLLEDDVAEAAAMVSGGPQSKPIGQMQKVALTAKVKKAKACPTSRDRTLVQTATS